MRMLVIVDRENLYLHWLKIKSDDILPLARAKFEFIMWEKSELRSNWSEARWWMADPPMSRQKELSSCAISDRDKIPSGKDSQVVRCHDLRRQLVDLQNKRFATAWTNSARSFHEKFVLGTSEDRGEEESDWQRRLRALKSNEVKFKQSKFLQHHRNIFFRLLHISKCTRDPVQLELHTNSISITTVYPRA